MPRFISFFGAGELDIGLLGGKGYHLDQMTKLELPVPEGFTITTEAYHEWAAHGGLTPTLEEEIRAAIQDLEEQTNSALGDLSSPLFVSVRSGAPLSMPGMMDTALNVGATDDSIEALAGQHDSEFAYNTYLDFMKNFVKVVHDKVLYPRSWGKQVPIPRWITFYGLHNIDHFEEQLQYLASKDSPFSDQLSSYLENSGFTQEIETSLYSSLEGSLRKSLKDTSKKIISESDGLSDEESQPGKKESEDPSIDDLPKTLPGKETPGMIIGKIISEYPIPSNHSNHFYEEKYIKKEIGHEHPNHHLYSSSPGTAHKHLDESSTPEKKIQSIDDVLPSTAVFGLDRLLAFRALQNEIRLTGSAIRENQNGHMRNGKISLVTENYLKVCWEGENFEEISWDELNKKGGRRVVDLYPELRKVAEDYIAELRTVGQLKPDTLRTRKKLEEIPTDPVEQVLECVGAVFRSWNNEKAVEYRKISGIPHNLGTAVNVQRMVFGNKDEKSGTAVMFTSCPRTGNEGITGEFMKKTQGEDLVSGKGIPTNLSLLQEEQPELYDQLDRHARTLEDHHGLVQDIEVTWEAGELYVLQTRTASLSPLGNIGFALRQYRDGSISEGEVIKRIDYADLEKIVDVPRLEISPEIKPITQGESLVGGVVVGKIAQTKDEVEALKGENIVYCAIRLTPEDISIINDCDAILIEEGGLYSHAGIVAMSQNKVVVVGCEAMNLISGVGAVFPEQPLHSGDVITVDGHSGNVYEGKIKSHAGRSAPEVAEIARISKEVVKELPEVYEIQCLDDLASISPERAAGIIYSIDYDCFHSAGILQNSAPKKKWVRKKVEAQAKQVYETLAQLDLESTTLKIGNYFDSQLESVGLTPSRVHQWFLNSYLSQLHRRENTQAVIIDKSQEKMKLPTDQLAFQSSNDYQTGQNCVLIKPWIKEEGYFLAAKEALQ